MTADLSTTIAPKSEQVNADDLLAGPRTITVTRVVLTGSADQPVKIFFEGDEGKPYLPCKSMRRVLFVIWGKDGNSYVGRRMTLYRDPTVKFGGELVGGIRISHLSDIDKPVTVALTVTRGSRKPYTVEPLKIESAPKKERQQRPIAERVEVFMSSLKTLDTVEGVERAWTNAAQLREAVDPVTLENIELAYSGRLDDVRVIEQQRKEQAS